MAVNDIITTQQTYAANAVEDADSFLADLRDISSSYYFGAFADVLIPEPGYGFDTLDEIKDLLTNFFPAAPDVGDISATAPTYTPGTVTLPEAQPIPEFTATPPTLAIPAAPDNTLPTVPATPIITDPTLPDSPVVTLPVAPEVGLITLPDVPSVEIPTFDAQRPVDDLVAPSNNFEFYEQLYSSALMDELKSKLLNDLQNGGYGIEPADEAALWDRARSREIEAAMSEAESLIAQAASRGFSLPPGDLNVALQRAEQNVQEKISGISRDIALKRADLYVQNRQFTIEQTRQLEQVLIGYHNSVMERALNAAKATLDAAIQIFNAQVSRYNARLDTYKTEAAVFESRLRAAMTQVEIYRATLEGKKVEADIQRVRVDVYNAQLAGVTAVVNLYKTQMEAAQVQAGIERLRIDAFRSLIDAYSAQVQAKVAEFNMYDSQIKGEIAKVNAYESEARAYSAVVTGARAKTDLLIARLRGEVDVESHKVDVFKAQLDKYRADIGAQAEVIRSKIGAFVGETQGAAARAGALGEALKINLSERDLEFKRNVENARLAIQNAQLFLEGAMKSADIRVRAGGAAAGYYQALVGSALNSINTLSSLVEQV